MNDEKLIDKFSDLTDFYNNFKNEKKLLFLGENSSLVNQLLK